MPIAMTQALQALQALQASLRGWAQLARPLAVVRAMESAAGHGLPTAGAAEGQATYAFVLTRCLSIASGTTRIPLNQVAERVLGLPR